MIKTKCVIGGLALMTGLLCTAWASAQVSSHPMTVWDTAELARLQSVRTTTHIDLANNLRRYLDLHNGTPVAGANVAGFAMMTRIWGDRPTDKANAIASLINHCATAWASDPDIDLASDVLNAAVGYDVLYDLLNQKQRDDCRHRIEAGTSILADAADSGVWWSQDLVNNHNWVNYAAIGVASQALEGESAKAAHWGLIAQANFNKVKAVQDLVLDGSWHEGIGYMEFGLERAIAFWLGAVRRGNNDDKSAMLGHVGRFILYAQQPNHPRVHVITNGDWVWSRPGLIAVLRWAARRFQDAYAAEAARRWDLEPRLLRVEFGLDYALEYVAYDPQVLPPDMTTVPLDVYNEDQQSVLMRSSWAYGSAPPLSDPIVLAFKAGVFGGRGNYERMRTCAFPGGVLNYSHDHEDDLSLWIYGKGGWLLPEAVGYNCCDTQSNAFHSSAWHNTFLFDGQGQLGDDKTSTGASVKACGSALPPWFYDRDASMPLHASTDHYAFARGSGAQLYPSTLNTQALLRTVGLSREDGGFIVLQDRVLLGVSRRIEQVFHSLNPAATTNSDRPWLKLTNLNDTVLGVRVISPSLYDGTVSTQLSNDYQENMGPPDGIFGQVTVSPIAADSNVIFLEFLWPTRTQDWANRPNPQPLDLSKPHRGLWVLLGASVESWIYNASGSTTAAGDLTIQGSNANDIGIRRTDSAGMITRVVIVGSGKLLDQKGARTLLDTGPNQGALEVAFTGSQANLSGTAGISGVSFYGPNVSEVRHQGAPVPWTRSGPMVTVN
jgi:hypothetical protein